MTGAQQFSGAVISYLSDQAVSKTADDPQIIERLHKQAHYMQWLNDAGPMVCPNVTRFLEDGYVMERCHPFTMPSDENDLKQCLVTIKNHLTRAVWQRHPVISENPLWLKNLMINLERTLVAASCPEKSRDTITCFIEQTFKTTRHKPQAIHGDATMDNVLLKAKDEMLFLLISDPIPPDERIPNDRCVDIGKLMQSVLGWEGVKSGGEWRKERFEEIWNITDFLAGEDADSVMRSYAWCLVHLIRILPYAQKMQNQELQLKVMYAILYLIKEDPR